MEMFRIVFLISVLAACENVKAARKNISQNGKIFYINLYLDSFQDKKKRSRSREELRGRGELGGRGGEGCYERIAVTV